MLVFFFRGKLNLNGNMELVHPIVEPINLRLDMKRALPPHRTDLHYDVFGKLHIVKVRTTIPYILSSRLTNFKITLDINGSTYIVECQSVSATLLHIGLIGIAFCLSVCPVPLDQNSMATTPLGLKKSRKGAGVVTICPKLETRK